ncbi:pyridoxamine 5'-phosphate oxidase-like protein [Nocardioides sp. J9]|uniref:pyridoxamine 5'-phosphate oxidase family protein n=1 Tax=unclassified Nocardioides TaxID=2615069 RepID=UPI0011AC7A44|nr:MULTISPECIES: pyridoxamine 5'-phosphate oxidase family protein [unclassified Nocardioides]TWH01501.1 pyridoxamine 5'-phosphate oxidase-like protein [Nocardioides sp. J9]
MSQSEVQPGRLVVLTEPECWELVRTQPVGRVAWAGTEGISVVPVNFLADDGGIVLRTTPYSLLARDSAEREVAFQVDHVDPDSHEGWSVLLRGRCHRVRAGDERPETWVTGARTLDLRVEVTSVSGRRVVSPTTAG